MTKRPPLTPCIICEKAVIYLWDGNISTNLNSAVDVSLYGYYGSNFDTSMFRGIICDECVDHLVQSKRLRFVGYNYDL